MRRTVVGLTNAVNPQVPMPCGIAGVEMTSVEREVGKGGRVTGEGSWQDSVRAVVRGFETAFGFRAVPRELPVPAAHSP